MVDEGQKFTLLRGTHSDKILKTKGSEVQKNVLFKAKRFGLSPSSVPCERLSNYA